MRIAGLRRYWSCCAPGAPGAQQKLKEAGFLGEFEGFYCYFFVGEGCAAVASEFWVRG
jgi:hypothetical protein